MNSGAGNAFRSSLPFTVNGNRSSTTTAAGTMNSGSRPATKCRTSDDSLLAPGSLTYAVMSPSGPSGRKTSDTATDACAFRCTRVVMSVNITSITPGVGDQVTDTANPRSSPMS
ncbi:Uncharacterised protein [Rhodococcus wratislaviensis]|uniref:Uncharacterized protein n=1 Tax=Rhodococcus wratislaviensis TaxID=44752 RepID=A0AB38F9F3_RHOWR|nr:Uncharacterised protein [Rhodococcus wratislaviensis]